MKKLNKEEMLEINGGSISITASFVNALTNAAETLLELGRSLGSSLRRIFESNSCSLK